MSAATWAGRVALLLGGLLVGIAGAELLSRVVQPDASADLLFNSPESSPQKLYIVDHERMLTPRPGFQGEIRSPGYRVSLRINALGLRGPEPETLPAEQPQWLAVGDSFTMAVQVPEAETFADRLGAAEGAQVWNGGVDGYSTWQALSRYTTLDETLPIERVVLMFFLGNDLQDNVRFPHIIQGARARPQGADIPRPETPPLQALLLRRSRLYAHWRVRSRRASLLSGADPDRERWRQELVLFSSEGRGELGRMLPQTREALHRLQQATRQRGDDLLVAVAPPAFVVDPQRAAATFGLVGLDPARAALDAPRQAVLSILGELGIAACDLTEPLRSASAPYFIYDGHWTTEGHTVVAETLSRCISSP
jgi:hypothetical protein